MSIERDQSTRKQMRAGIAGENVLRPLDEFSVTDVMKATKVREEDYQHTIYRCDPPMPFLPDSPGREGFGKLFVSEHVEVVTCLVAVKDVIHPLTSPEGLPVQIQRTIIHPITLDKDGTVYLSNNGSKVCEGVDDHEIAFRLSGYVITEPH